MSADGPNRREVMVSGATCIAAATSPLAQGRSRVPPKLQKVLDELAKLPPSPNRFIREHLERTEGWIDRALSGEP